MSQNSPVLGNLVKKGEYRDAVHIAITPVVACQDLEPGDHVGLRPDNGEACRMEPKEKRTIGIVDPFLTARVKKGERFWLCLYPNSITSLRHVWTHPAFTAKPPAPKEAKP
jgi:hypothetical protein